MPTLDGDFEGQQVGFSQRRPIDARVQRVAVDLVGVEREMLDGRDHVLRLDAAHRLSGEHAREQRVLAEVFEIPPVTRVARQVHAAGQQHVEALGAGLAAHQCAGRIRR